MKKRNLPVFLIFSFLSLQAYSQSKLGLFESQTSIGNPLKKGYASYDSKTQEYLVYGAGENMWSDNDEFHFVHKKIKGNFILRFRGKLLGGGADPHRKFGWMIRQSLDSNSAHVNAVVHGDGLTSLQFRRNTANQTEEIKSSITKADVVQVERKGNKFILSVAKFGDPFVSTELDNIDLGDEVFVGLFVCSHNKNVLEKALFRDVRIIIPAHENFVPYRDYIGSHLELMDVKTGNTETIYYSPNSIQAPNWSNDGRFLIYNMNGLLYKFDIATKKPTKIETGIANANNNDHVISFDGKILGISHNNQKDSGQSIVYTVPISGGQPKRITSKGPSYLHGWSPDGRWLVFTGGRNGDYDIYKIAAKGGEEIRLTDAKGLDDGAEFSRDGKYIWFNSTRSGTMQIWRMLADGSSQEQITKDEFNNWFPHVSPDGKWVVFISFSKEVAPDDHPFYKHVYLRLMPVSGGPAKIIGYLYGGQATINVPSWSPDSKRIAYVSNSN